MSETEFEPETRLFIDGEFCEAASGKTYANINPTSEAELGRMADADLVDMDRAIGAARRAFDETSWSTDPAFRQRCLTQLQEGLEKEKEALRHQTVAEVGAPLQLTYGPQGDSVIADQKWVTELIGRYEWDRSLGNHTFFGMNSERLIWKEAIGVVAAITPWNFPLQVNLAKVFPALAAGNTVILKPAPDTPWNASFIARMVAEHTEIPAGVFNVVTAEDPARTGDALTADARVDLVSFTGSTAVGKHISARAAGTVKRVFLELGGKSVYLALEDADLAQVLPGAAVICMHGGQGCAMTTRCLVPRSRYDEAIEILKPAIEAIPYGDPADPANLQGPQINARQQQRILGYVQKGIDEGATLLTGGKRPAQFEKGFFVEPTLFGDVDNKMTIAQEEIFGPVQCVIPYEDEADAIRIANDSIYGLSGSIFSADLSHALQVARQIRTGTLGVNGGMWFSPDAPFGGYKQSGNGREMGLEGFEEYLETKSVGIPAKG